MLYFAVSEKQRRNQTAHMRRLICAFVFQMQQSQVISRQGAIIGPDLGTNCLQRLISEDTSRKRVNNIQPPGSRCLKFVVAFGQTSYWA